MARTLFATLLPALAITVAWASVEDPRLGLEVAAVAALALVSGIVRPVRARVAAIAASAAVAAWTAFGVQPWELLPFRDERAIGPLLRDAGQGLMDFYAVVLPFDPGRNPEMHSLVLAAVFGFTLAVSLLARARRPIAAAAVTVAGVGWPATLLGGTALAVGALALAAALAIPLILRATSVRALVGGALVGGLVVGGAASASSATALAKDAAVDWQSWDFPGARRSASGVRFVWDSNYDGISFPHGKTVVLRVEGVASPRYWRAATLDLFTHDHWLEDASPLDEVAAVSRTRALGQLTPSRARNSRNWLEQRIRIEALVDDHLAAAGTATALDAPELGRVFLYSNGTLRARDALREGDSYRVWSYAPDPSRASLAAAQANYPAAASRYLELEGVPFPSWSARDRDRRVRGLFADPSYPGLAQDRPLYSVARSVAGRARTPYGAVLALESWFRQTGGFQYDESPPRAKDLPPLVAFLTRTKTGYCQHFAGAMAAMLRTLGVPARVAVGFTSGTRNDGAWVVTDHEAHAWVEAWFVGIGWIPFDPTPGRGTFGGGYSFASRSAKAVDALRRSELIKTGATAPAKRVPDASDLAATPLPQPSESHSPLAIALLLVAAWIVALGLGKALFRRSRYLSRDPRRVATATRRELEAFLRDQGVSIPMHATLVSLQLAMREELDLDAGSFASAVARARFGPPDEGAAGAARARRELRALLGRARRELSPWARFRGLVSLRSLRGAGT